MGKLTGTAHEKLLLQLGAQGLRSVISSPGLPMVGMESVKNELL
jgi:hypothetical protein